MAIRIDRAGHVLLVAAGLLLAYAVVRVLQPLVPALAASAVIAVVIHPMYARLLARRPDRPNAAAALATAAVCVAVVVPLAVGGWYLIREAVHAFPVIREQVQALTGPAESVPLWVPQSARAYLQDLNLKGLLLENIQGVGTWSGQFIRSMVGNVFSMVLNVLVFILCLFLFLRDGRETGGRLLASVPLSPRSKARIVGRTRDMIRATIQGVFAVAVLQGVLSVAGFALFDVRYPVLLGALCMLFSPLPFIGPTIVWIPVVARIALEGQFGRAALVALWFALIVGTLDNVLRPILIGTRSRLPVAIVVVGVLGGVRAFGVVGTVLGPVIMAIAVALVDALFPSPAHEDSERS
jgi:predicted PurR-regulated permease PerM